MCIVSLKNNFIFYHIPKCGGTSISNLMGDIKSNIDGLNHTHLTYLESKKLFEKKNLVEWFNYSEKFAVVRNPNDRAISFFKYIKQHENHYLNKRLFRHNFTQFLYFLKNVGDSGITTCYEHLQNENSEINKEIKIFKLEHIDNHIEELSDILNKKIVEVPKINTSDFKYEITDESDLLVKMIFEKDFNEFYF